MKFNAHSFLGQPLQNTISAKYLAEIKSISQKTGVTWILCKEIPELLKSELSEKILAMNKSFTQCLLCTNDYSFP